MTTRALVLSGGASHGAYQAGVIRALGELDWHADIVSGTSVGAINAAAYASHVEGDRLIDIWKNVSTDDVYQWRSPFDLLNIRNWTHLFDTSPLRSFLDDHIDLDSLWNSDRIALCAGTDVKDGHLVIFSNHMDDRIDPIRDEYHYMERMDIDAILSSCAIPGLFPWVNGRWDGSIQLRTPLKPVVKLGADEIVIVNIDHSSKDRRPEGLTDLLMKITNISSTYQLHYDLNLLRRRNDHPDYRSIDTYMIKPDERFDYSKLNFSHPNMGYAIQQGYNDTLSRLEGALLDT